MLAVYRKPRMGVITLRKKRVTAASLEKAVSLPALLSPTPDKWPTLNSGAKQPTLIIQTLHVAK